MQSSAETSKTTSRAAIGSKCAGGERAATLSSCRQALPILAQHRVELNTLKVMIEGAVLPLKHIGYLRKSFVKQILTCGARVRGSFETMSKAGISMQAVKEYT